MNGIEKILNTIENDSKLRCDAIIKNAEKQAQAILQKAELQANAEYAAIIESAEEKCIKIAQTAQARAAQIKRQELLKAKVNVIDDSINAASEKLSSLPDAEYFAALLTLISRHAQAGKCELLLNEHDNSRLPSGFIKEATEIAEKKSAHLIHSEENASVKNGFILRYGDIEINCSFDSLIDECREELKEKVNSILI